MYTLIESQEYCGEFGEILDMVEEQCEFSTYKLMETYKKRPYIPVKWGFRLLLNIEITHDTIFVYKIIDSETLLRV